MPHRQDVLATLLAAKERATGAGLAFVMAYLRGRYDGDTVSRTLIDATMCAIMAWFIRDILGVMGLGTELAYAVSVFTGYLGTASAGALIRRWVDRKTGGTGNDCGQ